MTTTRRTASSRRRIFRQQSRAALAAGRTLAAEVLRVRNAALAQRQRALKRLPARAVAGAQLFASPRRIQAAGAPARATLVAEGDSWFNYPWHDVLSLLEDQHGYDVESVAHWGDPVESMAYSGGQLAQFTSTIEKLLRRGVVPAAILLSGGGNDIAGDSFATLLNHAASPHPGLNDTIVTGVIDQRVKDAIVAILGAVTMICEERTGHTIPIVLHGYDYAMPDGRGVLGGFGPLPGPWLQPGFRDKGFADLAQNHGMIVDLIDRFNTMLAQVPAIPDFAHVRYLNLRGTLSDAANYKTWWANELHPTKAGFAAVADKFAAVI